MLYQLSYEVKSVWVCDIIDHCYWFVMLLLFHKALQETDTKIINLLWDLEMKVYSTVDYPVT